MRWKNCFLTKKQTCVVLVVVFALCIFLFVDLEPLTGEISYRVSKKVYHFTDERTPPLSSVSRPYLTLRSVYYDPRRRHGYNGMYVFMVEVAKPLLSRPLIVGCGIAGHHSTKLRTRPLHINGWVGNYLDERPSLTHTMAVVDCFNLPSNLANGSNATIRYRTSSGGAVMEVPSERPFVLPLTATPASRTRPYKIAACLAVVYGRPPFLGSWLRYQRAIGVSHVHMIAEAAFVADGGLRDTFLADSIRDAFVTVDVWEPHLVSGLHIHYHSQLLAYHDCLYRFASAYDYMFFADQDDFFVPLHSYPFPLKYYVDRWCSKGSCAFDWVEMYPDCGMKNGDRADGNLTALLVSDQQKKMPFKKCIHRLQAAIEVGIHDARELVPGFEAVEVPAREGYVAHLRKHRLPADGNCA